MTLDEFKSKCIQAAWNIVEWIEDSPVFERTLIHYENLDPLRQKRWRSSFQLSFYFLALMILLTPLIWTQTQKTNIQSYLKLFEDLRIFNRDQNIIIEKAPPPADWLPMNANSFSDAENSLNQLFSNLSIDGEHLEMDSNTSTNTFTVQIKELTLKQAVSLLYQLDGWYPSVQTKFAKLEPHPKSKDMVALNLELAWTGLAGSLSGYSPTQAPSSGRFRPEDFESEDDLPLPPSQAQQAPYNPSQDAAPLPPTNNPGNIFPNDDFEGDLPPPSFLDDE